MPGLYLHIPYCDHKCLYCDFYSIESLGTMDHFLDSLKTEIGLYGNGGGPVETPFDSIFFGGGTPSLLDPEVVSGLLVLLRDTFPVAPGAEVTLETNPGTVDERKLEGMLRAGVNRLSVGIQSFHEDELKTLTRIHDADTARRCVRDAFSVGFTNLNVDLIFALPGQTVAKWEYSLGEAIALGPQHISAYCLIYEEGTPLLRMVRARQITPLPGEAEADLFEITMDRLDAAGYRQYEVSNFALEGRQCRHNLTYWRHGEYLGFGPSAHSFSNGRRWWNASSIRTYLDRLGGGLLPVAGEETLGPEEMFTEMVMLGLRTGRLDLPEVHRKTGIDILETSRKLIPEIVARGLAVFERPVLRLTREGLMVCDELSARFIHEASTRSDAADLPAGSGYAPEIPVSA